MKIRNEVWMIKGDGSVARKEKTADNGTMVVIYTVAAGFGTATSTATFISLGNIGANLHLSRSLHPETTFPEMLADFHEETDDGILGGLKFNGFDISDSGTRHHMLRAVRYAWEHVGDFGPEEFIWAKV